MPVDLSIFCASDDDPREYLRHPFNLDEHTYATNGHLAVRVPRRDACEIISDYLKPEYLKKQFDQPSNPAYRPLGAIPDILMKGCKTCRGGGKALRLTCHECNGHGEATAKTDYNEYEVPCRTCNEEGELLTIGGECDCPDCDGIGKVRVDKRQHVLIDGHPLGINLAHMIKDLPNISISPFRVQNSSMMFSIKFDGGEGVITGMNLDD